MFLLASQYRITVWNVYNSQFKIYFYFLEFYVKPGYALGITFWMSSKSIIVSKQSWNQDLLSYNFLIEPALNFSILLW